MRKWTYIFYEDGLSVNVMYPLDNPKKRAVGFKKPRFGNRIPEPPGGETGKGFKTFAKGAGRLVSDIQRNIDNPPAAIHEQEAGTLHRLQETY